jgi:alpha-ketoglutarate-dependent taurine dioxygenase
MAKAMTASTEPLIPVPAAPQGHTYRQVTVAPVAGACGAVVGGVDLASNLDDEVIAEIRRAVLDHHVVFFRGQRLSPHQQVAFSRRFGPYSPVPFVEPIAEHPEVIAVIRDASETQHYTFGSLWHSDFSFLPEPPFASILHALEVPPSGGDTIWANQHLAYDTLSSGMQTMLEGLVGLHSAINAYSPQMQAIHDTFVGMNVHTSDEANRVERHPVVRVHGETGRKALYVSTQYTIGLDGFSPFDAKPILDLLYAQSTRPELTCRWRWEVGDVAMWDNRALQHMALADFTGHRRSMLRTTVAGERPQRCSTVGVA